MSNPNPGSDIALAQGCTCPVMDNGHGQGSMWGKGVFVVMQDCPLHGSMPLRYVPPPAGGTLTKGKRHGT